MIYVVGSGGHAKVVIQAMRQAGIQPDAVLDDNPERHGLEILGLTVVGDTKHLSAEHDAILAIGSAKARAAISQRCEAKWLTIVHPKAFVDPTVELGEGTVVCAGAIVQPSTKVGRHAILNTGCTVDHDNVIGDFAQVAPGANLGGTVTLEEGAFVGLGASIIQGIRVGAWSLIGAGATVIRDVAPSVTVIGVPAAQRP